MISNYTGNHSLSLRMRRLQNVLRQWDGSETSLTRKRAQYLWSDPKLCTNCD